MRNPERIKEVMDVLTKIWEAQPDTRFNQLIYNLQREYAKGSGETVYKLVSHGHGVTYMPETKVDLFNLEDDKFLEFLKTKIIKD